ncbi:hypothetical protein vBPFY1MI_75 [Pseudomonas phage vB_PF_Y1-MI]|nr:hypothetical protein vBPFY1MI_75 [Pseudomonas phage vB_PF_Y1-MI]
MSNKLLVSFHWDCGRMGGVEGLFITTQSALECGYGKRVYFGEILGKHSEVYGTLETKDIEVISEDQDFIEKLEDLLGVSISGYNPLEYISENSDEEE